MQVTTSLLLLLLGGPLRAATYILLHGAPRRQSGAPYTQRAETLPRAPPGSLGIATGVLWSQKRHWLLSVPAAALVSGVMLPAIRRLVALP